MSIVRGIAIFTAWAALTVPTAHGQELKRDNLLRAFEKQLQETTRIAGPSMACVVVSRSESYPKSAIDADKPGKLGDFDAEKFIKANPSRERADLARSLNLSDPEGIPDHGFAGGVVIDTAGYVLTPYHVIDGAKKIYVFLPGSTGSYADIHAADARSDLAVLKLLTPPPKMTAIKYADVRTRAIGGKKATVSTGTLCILMAYTYSASTQFRQERPSAAFGSITNIRIVKPKERPTQYVEYGPVLEYDLKFLPGEKGGLNADVSGAALLNLDGEMIGLTNTAATSSGEAVGPGYAIPADDKFRRIVETLRRGEEVEYGFLGVTATQLPRIGNDVPNRNGVTIDGVTPFGPAAQAGIQGNDVISAIDGMPIATFNDLLFYVGHALAGSKVTITATRFGRTHDFEVTLAKYQHNLPFITSVRPEPVFGLRVEYSSVLSQRENNGLVGEPQTVIPVGVGVREVVANTPAATAFKTLGDNPKKWLITKVDGKAVSTPAAFYRAAKGQEKIKLTIIDPKQPFRERELTLP